MPAEREPPWVAAVREVERRASGPALDRSLRVTVHFHPDRLVAGRLLVERLATNGRYRSQFETSTSNGGLTAYPGGDRWQWESRLFGRAYDEAPPSLRPTYGALNHRRRRAGGSVRFGSAHLRLTEASLDRTTFCYPDSVFEPTAVGTASHLALISLADADRRDFLDDYVEAHLHGPLAIAADAEAVVLDPAYRGTAVERAAHALPVPVEWHDGFRLHVDDLARYADYRGADTVAAGTAVAVDGWLDPVIIGRALARDESQQQTLKRVWHCVARFGGSEP